MSDTQFLNRGLCSSLVLDRIKGRQEVIHQWLQSYEGSKELPLYSSVDIRDASFKIAVIDTNIFPAGFNNLCEHGIEDSVKFMRQAILRRVPNCRDILIVAEEHTRNTWYLENVRILQQIIENAGFNAKVASFFTVHPEFCENANYVELETATQNSLRVFCFKKILNKIETGMADFDLIILNNDLTTGIPDVLKETNVPIYPSAQAGWHSRSKSRHFKHTADLISEFAKIVDLDPWLFSCYYRTVDQVNINVDTDRGKLMDAASDLFLQIEEKYKKEHIQEKPFIFIKSDSGTYGMGVLSIENPKDILELNRKNKNKLYKGKGSQVIERYLLQEGVPTIYNIDQQVSEVVLYQIEHNLVGGFYRSHATKSDRENLNAQGMDFKKICPRLPKYGECGVHMDVNIFDIYRILGRIAGIAAHREIIQLEAEGK